MKNLIECSEDERLIIEMIRELSKREGINVSLAFVEAIGDFYGSWNINGSEAIESIQSDCLMIIEKYKDKLLQLFKNNY